MTGRLLSPEASRAVHGQDGDRGAHCCPPLPLPQFGGGWEEKVWT